LSESVPASSPKAAWNFAGWACANGNHQSDRKRKRSVLSQNLLHVKLLYVNLNYSYCS